ncbi:recombinase family protein [Pseudomonas extremaustralis]|uniref:recombinase family protein n=1 Tax=Pseudomonas TaxID=286 RepID=UPI0021C5F0EC|nr:recombinase family protein [Pseudomonas extremaustralis]MDG2970083.1 recombinase family protein [Pseudomonas extremaustralis]UUJ38189.1 recombinase family protein [Pseudomonas extremaustralis]
MPNAYAYVRYSSTVQSSGDSVDRQTSPLKAFERETGVDIVETIIDEGVSSFRGDNANKGKFKEVLARIERGVIRRGDYLVVESIDRITRQRVLDGVELLQNILKAGVKIYTTTDSRCYSYDDPDRDFENLIMISLIAKRANEESEIKSKRRKSAWNKAKLAASESGKKFNAHNPPYGYRYDVITEQFVIAEDEASEIRMIFELLKTMGVSNATRRVNVSSKRKWTSRQVALMIENKYPLGMLMSQKRNEKGEKVFVEYIDEYYPKIISQTAFNEAVASMRNRQDRKDYGNTTIGSTNIFRHVIKCAECGETMMFEKQKNQKGVMYPYFNCFTRKELKGQCDQRFRFDLAFGMLLHGMQVIQSKASPGVIRYEFETDGKKKVAQPNGHINSTVVKRMKMDPIVRSARRTSMTGFGDEFSSFLSDDKKSRELLGSNLAEASEVLAGLKEKYENIEKSLDGFDGKIPMPIIKRLESLEIAIDDQVALIDKLSDEYESSVTDIKLTTIDDVVEQFRTEEGRLKLNQFFKASKIVFKFRYDKSTRSLHMWVNRDTQEILSISRKFPLHKPLSHFGIPRLADLYEQI